MLETKRETKKLIEEEHVSSLGAKKKRTVTWYGT